MLQTKLNAIGFTTEEFGIISKFTEVDSTLTKYVYEE
jgi:hypothetical protein